MPDHDRPTPVDGHRGIARDTPPPPLAVNATTEEAIVAYRALAAYAVRHAGMKPWVLGLVAYSAAVATALLCWAICVHSGGCH